MAENERVVIIGAGPYALSTAAFLRRAGVEPRVFGEVMGFWNAMPRGMYLRSARKASSIADPERALRLDGYEASIGRKLTVPTTLEDFIEYGRWFRDQIGVEVDSRRVTRVANGTGFRVTTDDGEEVQAAHVVVAVGIEPFSWRPEMFDGLRLVARQPHLGASFVRRVRREVRARGRGGPERARGGRLPEGAGVVRRGDRPSLRSALSPRRGCLAERRPDEQAPLSRVGGRATGRQSADGPAVDLPRAAEDDGRAARLPGDPPCRIRAARGAPRGDRDHDEPPSRRARDQPVRRWRSSSTTAPSASSTTSSSRPAIASISAATRSSTRSSARRSASQGSSPKLSSSFSSSVPGLYFVGAPAAASLGPGMRFVSHTGFAAKAITSNVLRD